MPEHADILIFDLDDTLLDPRTRDLFPQVRAILQRAKDQGHRMFLASFNPRATRFLEWYEIQGFFEGVAKHFSDVTKPEQIDQLAREHGFELGRVWFFDDVAENVGRCRVQGIRCVHVDSLVGVTDENVFAKKSATPEQREAARRDLVPKEGPSDADDARRQAFLAIEPSFGCF